MYCLIFFVICCVSCVEYVYMYGCMLQIKTHVASCYIMLNYCVLYFGILYTLRNVVARCGFCIGLLCLSLYAVLVRFVFHKLNV